MTFLELCQKLVRKAGISSAPVSVLNQVGEAGRVVDWIAEAYEFVQNKHPDWEFLRAGVSFPTTAGKERYTPAEALQLTFGQWRFALTWRCYHTAQGVADEQIIDYMPYDDWRSTYMMGTNRLATGRPQIVTQAPNQSLVFWPTPDDNYTIIGEQYTAPAVMAANTDVPIFAARFHNAIVYRALMLYGEFEGDPNTFSTGQTEFARYLSMLESAYLPDDWDNAGAMA